MAVNHLHNRFGRILIACIAVSGLFASEHHGVVKSNGMPVPGATVTATMGDKKQVTTTDDQGAYSFADLEDGNWTISIDMLGFAKITKEVGVVPGAPSPTFDMNLLTADKIKEAVAARLSPTTASAPAASPATSTPATTAAATPPANTNPSTSTASTPANPTAGRPGNGTQTASGRGNGGGRGNGNAANGTNGGRPSIRTAQQQQQNGFQRADVTQQADVGNLAAGADMSMNNVDMSQSQDAIVAVGSVNQGLGMPEQNDWGMGGRGMGGPGGPMGFGIGGDGMPGQLGADGGGAGGPGGGGRGGPGGGGPGGGGRGGFAGGGGFGGGMPMAPGGRGGRGGGGQAGRGGRGGPGGRGNMASFGNGRRGSRPRYNANLAFILDNSALDARSYSIAGADTAKAAYAKARLTASGGGPLKIPHLLSGDKTTFFLNYQLTRNRNGNTLTGLMPTAAERTGDFSQAVSSLGTPVTIFDPLNGNPFPGNVIPSNRISSQASSLMNFYPLPNFPANSRFNYQIPSIGITNQDNINTRLNHTINQKNQINGSIAYQRSDITTPNIFGFIDSTHMTGWNTSAGWIHHFSPRVTSTARYTFSRQNQQALPYFANGADVALNAGILGTNQDPLYFGPPTLSFTNFAGLSDSNPTINRNQTQSAGDTVMLIHGLHTLQIGADVRRQQINPLSQQNARGTFGFNGTATQQVINGAGVNNTGYDFADFLLGYADTTNIAYGNADKYFRTTWLDAFVNDDWRVNTKLTLVSGLRWEYGSPINELYGRLVNLEIGPAFSSITPICGADVPGTGCTLTGSQAGLPGSLINPYRRAIEPRIGFAYRPFPKMSTVVRGGYGIYYNTSVYTQIANQMAQQSPISTSARLSSTPGNLLTMATGLLVPANVVTNTFAIDPNFHVGYTQNWQLAVQQNLKWSLVATVTYVGSKGTRLPQEFLPNSVPSGFTAGNALVPGPFGPSGYTYETSNGNNTYNAAMFQLQRRFRSGFSGNVQYVFARAIDDAFSGNAAIVAQNWLDLDAERARTTGIRTHTLNMQLQYSTGVGTRGGTLLKGWKGRLIKDWTMSTNITVGSGLPLTATVPVTVKGTGVAGSERPNLTGLSIYDASSGYNLNPQAFIAPAPGTWGSLGRNTIIGPGQFSLNGQASRTIRIGERHSADLQFQANNLLNHVTFPSWNTSVTSSQFGLPTTANSMRVIQATLRFRF